MKSLNVIYIVNHAIKQQESAHSAHQDIIQYHRPHAVHVDMGVLPAHHP